MICQMWLAVSILYIHIAMSCMAATIELKIWGYLCGL